jgi:hypothetical protein
MYAGRLGQLAQTIRGGGIWTLPVWFEGQVEASRLGHACCNDGYLTDNTYYPSNNS